MKFYSTPELCKILGVNFHWIDNLKKDRVSDNSVRPRLMTADAPAIVDGKRVRHANMYSKNQLKILKKLATADKQFKKAKQELIDYEQRKNILFGSNDKRVTKDGKPNWK